jgi:hypothetical protein
MMPADIGRLISSGPLLPGGRRTRQGGRREPVTSRSGLRKDATSRRTVLALTSWFHRSGAASQPRDSEKLLAHEGGE